MTIFYIIYLAYNWKALSLLSTSATLLVSLVNMSIYSVISLFMSSQKWQRTRNSQKLKKHPTFISTKYMLCLSIQFDIFLVWNIDDDLYLSKVLHWLSTVYASYQGSKDDLKRGLFWNMDPVFRLKKNSHLHFNVHIDNFEVVWLLW